MTGKRRRRSSGWLDSLVQRIRDHRWRFNLRKHLFDLDQVEIDRPVFLLGTQGGGLTLLSRVLRRHSDAISVTGDAGYWTGSDEMQNVLADALPDDLRLRGHPALQRPRHQESWLYASDALLPEFRRTGPDATRDLAEQLTSTIRELLVLHGNGRSGLRFVDKSQSYTLKVSFLAALLEDHDPRFLLVTRNPYAMCQRAVRKVLANLGMSRSERVECAVQHWDNSMRSALDDGRELEGFGVVRFEDFLNAPEKTLARIAEIVEMDLSPGLLPSSEDRMPLGTPPDGKWHPLRPDINDKYLGDLCPDLAEAVDERCEDLVDRLGYTLTGLRE